MLKKAIVLLMVTVMAISGVFVATGFVKANNGGKVINVKSDSVISVLTPGTSKSVKAGEKFIIALKENVTTGHSWSYKISDEAGITLYSVVGLEPAKTEGMGLVGAGTDKVWEFTAVKAGKYTITYEYKAPGTGKTVEKLVYKVAVVK